MRGQSRSKNGVASLACARESIFLCFFKMDCQIKSGNGEAEALRTNLARHR